MEYKQFLITIFERQPGKWRSTCGGRRQPLIATGRAKLEQFITA